MHYACIGIFFTAFGWYSILICVLAYLIRVFGLTLGYHRYFCHRAFATSRPFQFILALWGCSAMQLDPLWWASHHRWHHQKADAPDDVHSPKQQGFWHSHIGWLFDPRNRATNLDRVKDFACYPEILWLNKHTYAVPLLFGGLVFATGHILHRAAPGLGIDGWQTLFWGFFVSTVLLYHTTYSVNSLAHMFGRRRYDTKDTSRNNWLVAFLTMGEGWHNNHHRYAPSARHGFYPLEVDVTYYLICFFEMLGLVWDVRRPPKTILEEGRL